MPSQFENIIHTLCTFSLGYDASIAGLNHYFYCRFLPQSVTWNDTITSTRVGKKFNITYFVPSPVRLLYCPTVSFCSLNFSVIGDGSELHCMFILTGFLPVLLSPNTNCIVFSEIIGLHVTDPMVVRPRYFIKCLNAIKYEMHLYVFIPFVQFSYKSSLGFICSIIFQTSSELLGFVFFFF